MQRYVGGGFPRGSRIALIANDALGNFVVSTPLMQMLKNQVEDLTLHLYSGHRIAELADRSPLVDAHFPLFGITPREFGREVQDRSYDFVINVEDHPWAISAAAMLCTEKTQVVGRCLTRDGRGLLAASDDEQGRLHDDKEWIHAAITDRYSILDTGHISEIFCRLAYLEGPVPKAVVPLEDPARSIPDVLISASASLTNKLWPLERWRHVLAGLKQKGFTVGLLGAKPGEQSKFWDGAVTEQALVDEGLASDLRGELSLPQVGGAMQQARLVLTIDNGILHMACASGAPTVGLFRNGIHRLWAPPVDHLLVVEPGEKGEVAALNQELVLAECLKIIEESL